MEQGGVHVTGVAGVPLVDLFAGEPDRVGFRCQQRRRGLGANGLDAPAADDAKSAVLCFGEQRILGVRKERPEHHGRGGAHRDTAVAELDGCLLGEFGIGEPRLGREDAQVEPLQQLTAAIGVPRIGLGEVDMGVDEAG